MTRSITYDNINLQDNGITTSSIDIYSSAPIINQLAPVAFDDGGVLVRKRLDSKTINISGHLRENTTNELDATIDFFQASLNKRLKFLDVDYNGGTRRYVASPENIMITRPLGLNYATFDVQFIVPSGVGSDIETTELLNQNTTTSNVDMPFSVGGSYKAEPLIEITLNSVTGGTGGSITLTNTSTLEGLVISADFATSDLIEVDVEQKEVRINGGVVDYTGRIPFWAPGGGFINYADTFSARDADVVMTYTKRYI